MSAKPIRIGTRCSQLALWQANIVKNQLQEKGLICELVEIKSLGDVNRRQAIYEMSEVGVFTKTLDQALLNNQIDIAVHSMKDVPTLLTKGLVQVAVLKRGEELDVLVFKDSFDFSKNMTVATGSLRRKSQWLANYPEHYMVNLRGNLHTRLESLHESDWHGAIFAKAGLDRVRSLPENHIELDWMIPAPAQGAVVVIARESDTEMIAQVSELNHADTVLCVSQERAFLRTLEGGCSAPIGALMTLENDLATFRGGLFSLDGSKKVIMDMTIPLDQADYIGQDLAEEILNTGGREIMQEINRATRAKRRC